MPRDQVEGDQKKIGQPTQRLGLTSQSSNAFSLLRYPNLRVLIRFAHALLSFQILGTLSKSETTAHSAVAPILVEVVMHWYCVGVRGTEVIKRVISHAKTKELAQRFFVAMYAPDTIITVEEATVENLIHFVRFLESDVNKQIFEAQRVGTQLAVEALNRHAPGWMDRVKRDSERTTRKKRKAEKPGKRVSKLKRP